MRRWLLAGIFSLLLLLPGAALAAPVTVTGQGASVREAVHQALRSAIEQSVGVALDSRTRVEQYRVLEDRIYAHSEGFIESYRIVSEQKIGGVTRVTVSAEVSSSRLSAAVMPLVEKQALVGMNLGDPRVGVLAVDAAGRRFPVLEDALVREMGRQGFSRLIDVGALSLSSAEQQALSASPSSPAGLSRLRALSGLDLLAVCQVQEDRESLDAVMPGLHQVFVTASARLVRVQTGEILYAGNVSAQSEHWSAGAEQEAVRKAARAVAPRLARAALSRAAAVSQHLEVELPLALFGSLQAAQARFSAVPGVQQVFLRSLSGGRLVLDVDFDGTASDLAQALEREGFRVSSLAEGRLSLGG